MLWRAGEWALTMGLVMLATLGALHLLLVFGGPPLVCP
jgi:hypothetical protein